MNSAGISYNPIDSELESNLLYGLMIMLRCNIWINLGSVINTTVYARLEMVLENQLR